MKNCPSQLLAASAVLTLVALGCEEKSATPPVAVPKATHGPAQAPAAPSPTPAPSPAPGTSAAKPPASGANTISAAGYTFPIPAGWQSSPPSNQMRIAEVHVPDSSGDAAKACEIAFSMAGGDIQANIDRWAGQVQGPDGQPSKPTVQKKTIDGMNVTIAEMTGSYAGMGGGTPKPNTTLRGAIIETPGGMMFVKMIGPAAPMAAAAPGFDSMIDGMKKDQ